VVAFVFEANHEKQIFDNGWKFNLRVWASTIPALKTQAH